MADICVIHTDLAVKGGGEAVTMNVLEALQDEHDLTLVTNSDPDIREYNSYFDTDVDPSRITTTSWNFVRWTNSLLPSGRLHRIKHAILSRYTLERAPDADLYLSTTNELATPGKGLCYVHQPVQCRGDLDDPYYTKGVHRLAYERATRVISGINYQTLSSPLLTNSRWMSMHTERAYHLPTHTVYPPVDTRGLDGGVEWEDRENGFVAVGRLERAKRYEHLIRMVEAVADTHDVHMHIVGPTSESAYSDEIRELVDGKDFVTLEGEVSRDRIRELLRTHRYAIHGKENEHFGIAVAEFVAAGMIPFVPNSGGQVEIVDENPSLCYDGERDAADKIDTVLSNQTMQRDIRDELPNVSERFSRERFQSRIREIVSKKLKGEVFETH